MQNLMMTSKNISMSLLLLNGMQKTCLDRGDTIFSF